jgi:hypothetical protein
MICIIAREEECQRSLFPEVKSADASWVDISKERMGRFCQNMGFLLFWEVTQALNLCHGSDSDDD